MRPIVFVFLCLCTGLAADARAEHGKIDRLEFVNGDSLTCEVLSLDRGKLSAKVDGMGTLSIDWDRVKRIVSPASYQVELSSGQRLIGSIDTAASGQMSVRTGFGVEFADLADVVRMAPLETGFWRALDGSIDFGFNFAQADSLTQYSLNVALSRRTVHYLSQGSLNSQLTTDSSVSHQQRNTLNAQVARFLSRRWFVAPIAQLSQNEQLGLDIRTIAGGAVGRYVVQSNHALLALVGGATYTHEQFVDEPGADRAEGVAIVDWDWFTFGHRETDFSNVLQVYYNLGSETRVRTELSSSFRRKLFHDFTFSISLLESFDSAPPNGQKKNDSSVTAALGWSF